MSNYLIITLFSSLYWQ